MGPPQQPPQGLLEDTLVLFGPEFGHQPSAQGQNGRDHNITGYADRDFRLRDVAGKVVREIFA